MQNGGRFGADMDVGWLRDGIPNEMNGQGRPESEVPWIIFVGQLFAQESQGTTSRKQYSCPTTIFRGTLLPDNVQPFWDAVTPPPYHHVSTKSAFTLHCCPRNFHVKFGDQSALDARTHARSIEPTHPTPRIARTPQRAPLPDNKHPESASNPVG